jgi:hypothetical protein
MRRGELKANSGCKGCTALGAVTLGPALSHHHWQKEASTYSLAEMTQTTKHYRLKKKNVLFQESMQTPSTVVRKTGAHETAFDILQAQ